MKPVPVRSIARLIAALAVVALAPPAAGGEGFSIDFGVTYGVPAWNFDAASGQVGDWNMSGLGATPLVDLSGNPSGAVVSVSANLDTGFYGGPPTTEEELLFNDNFLSSSGGSWSVDLSGLVLGRYRLFLYAPRHTSVPTGGMTVEGVPVASIPGDSTAALIEGTSWVGLEVAITDGTLTILGSASGYSGLAGLQLVPIAPRGVNVDLGMYYVQYGLPGPSYGAASGQAGYWNPGRTGYTSLRDVDDTPAGWVHVSASSDLGHNGVIPTTDDERLLNDHYWGSSWITDFGYMPLGDYYLYFYAPSHAPVTTGDMNAEGVLVSSIPGHTGSVLVEGTSWVRVPVAITKRTFRITASGPGFNGLAGIQLVPIVPGGVNIDFGFSKGLPAASYGAASGQVGPWNGALLGFNALVDVAGVQAGTSVTVVAETDAGSASGPPANDDELLLDDNFYSLSGDTWSATLVGLAPGEHLAYIYAASNSVVPTGDMTVGGIPVASIPGDASAALIEGLSWVAVAVAAPDGALVITGAGSPFSGLAGLQVLPLPEVESYCSAGVSASGCTATLTSAGTPSATATSGFVLSAASVEGSKNGIFFFGSNGRQMNPWGSSGSFQCVVPPVKRGGLLTGAGTSGACDGAFSQDLNAHWTAKPTHNPGTGALVQAQLWYRDPFNTSNQTTSLSDAIEFVVRP